MPWLIVCLGPMCPPAPAFAILGPPAGPWLDVRLRNERAYEFTYWADYGRARDRLSPPVSVPGERLHVRSIWAATLESARLELRWRLGGFGVTWIRAEVRPPRQEANDE